MDGAIRPPHWVNACLRSPGKGVGDEGGGAAMIDEQKIGVPQETGKRPELFKENSQEILPRIGRKFRLFGSDGR